MGDRPGASAGRPPFRPASWSVQQHARGVDGHRRRPLRRMTAGHPGGRISAPDGEADGPSRGDRGRCAARAARPGGDRPSARWASPPRRGVLAWPPFHLPSEALEETLVVLPLVGGAGCDRRSVDGAPPGGPAPGDTRLRPAAAPRPCRCDPASPASRPRGIARASGEASPIASPCWPSCRSPGSPASCSPSDRIPSRSASIASALVSSRAPGMSPRRSDSSAPSMARSARSSASAAASPSDEPSPGSPRRWRSS